MAEVILIFDFGSQYTQLIARRVRELQVFCEIHPGSGSADTIVRSSTAGGNKVKGIILSGSPFSVHDKNAPSVEIQSLSGNIPVLGICYGAQFIAKESGGTVLRSEIREYGRANLVIINKEHPLFSGMENNTQVWMSHADTITCLPDGFENLASTAGVENGAFRHRKKNIFGLQFHPEVVHTTDGAKLLKNFLVEICRCRCDWTPDSFIDRTVAGLKEKLGRDKVILGISGGVDSTVAALLLHKAVGKNLTCLFVDNGLLRKNEYHDVLLRYRKLNIIVKGIDAKETFYRALKGTREPEKKRKIIGKKFIGVFAAEAKKITGVKWLGQGTIYPDVIESSGKKHGVKGPAATIKSHHNVGGLPEKMHLKIVEPLRMLFKDEVRQVGGALGVDAEFLSRHPFPGPGLGVRILGDITPEKVKLLQEADDIFIRNLHEKGLYHSVWQAATILLPVRSVGVMGDERTYQQAVCLRAVTSTDGMTADWCRLPYDFFAAVSNEIINRVKGINRVVYDISSKPPATIEWE